MPRHEEFDITPGDAMAAAEYQGGVPEEPEPDPQTVLVQACQGWLAEVMQLRGALRTPSVSAPHTVIHEAWVQARTAQDRMETLLSLAIGFKSSCEIAARRLEAAADDAWDDQAEKEKRRGSYGRREFEGAQERYAYWRLACREQRRAARQARELADVAADAERRIRSHYYGLDGARNDLSRRLTALTRQLNNPD